MPGDDTKVALWELFWNLPAAQQLGVVTFALIVASIGFGVGKWSVSSQAKIGKLEAEIVQLKGELKGALSQDSTDTQCEITIIEPADGAKVPQSFPVEAVISGVPEGSVPWVVTTERAHPSYYWPQSPAVKKNGKWVGKVDGIGGYVGKQRSFGILIVGRDGQLLIDAWREGWQKGRGPLKDMTRDTFKGAERDVIVNEDN